MKRIIATILVFVGALIFVKAEVQRLVVWQKSGGKVYFDLTDEPETTFEEGRLVIKTSKTTISYPLTDVLRYTYEGGTITDVGEAATRPGEVRYMQNENAMAFEGLPAGTTLEVYSLDGVKVTTVKAVEGRRTTVSLANQPAGTYIIKAGDTSFKFMKR